MLPKFAKDALKALRYQSEGVLNLRGDDVVGLDELSFSDVLTQGLGYTPAIVAERYEQNSAIKGTERRILRRRSLLLNRFALARRLEDKDLLNKVRMEIKAFNDANKQHPITEKTLIQSLKRRAQYSSKASNGVVLNSRYQYLNEEMSLY